MLEKNQRQTLVWQKYSIQHTESRAEKKTIEQANHACKRAQKYGAKKPDAWANFSSSSAGLIMHEDARHASEFIVGRSDTFRASISHTIPWPGQRPDQAMSTESCGTCWCNISPVAFISYYCSCCLVSFFLSLPTNDIMMTVGRTNRSCRMTATEACPSCMLPWTRTYVCAARHVASRKPKPWIDELQCRRGTQCKSLYVRTPGTNFRGFVKGGKSCQSTNIQATVPCIRHVTTLAILRGLWSCSRGEQQRKNLCDHQEELLGWLEIFWTEQFKLNEAFFFLFLHPAPDLRMNLRVSKVPKEQEN